jgi:hypothetical protein
MKTVQVSESALETIKRMAVEREQQIEQMRETIRAIQDVAMNADADEHWARVDSLCNHALCE